MLPKLVERTGHGDLSVSISRLTSVVEQELDLSGGYLEMTGGNCAAVHWDLDGGSYLLITNSDGFTYSRGDHQHHFGGWMAGVYRDDSDPVGVGVTERSDTEALVECIRLALRADGENVLV
jgi:hypothetical protein